MFSEPFIKNKKASLIRVLGKNGVYLALLLLEMGYEVHGTSRDHEASSWFSYKHGAMIHLNGIITDTEFPCISGYMNSRIAEGFYEIVEAKTIIEGDQKKTLVASRGEVLAKA